MSSLEIHRGKLKYIQKKDIVDKIQSIFKEQSMEIEQYDWDDIDDLYSALWDVSLDNAYICINDEWYEWIEHHVDFDVDDYLTIVNYDTHDETFNIYCKFYNGGTCLSEMLADDKHFNY